MAELNVDSSIIKNALIVQKEQEMKVVEMQNGCICCTLRADLLESISEMAKSGKFDYCVIESTGISEPMQVAETFSLGTMQSDGEGKGSRVALAEKPEDSLSSIARLDTCVTVVDGANFLQTFEDLRFGSRV